MSGGEPILAICGLRSEARIARGLPAGVVLSGADPARLSMRLGNLDPSSIRLVISFGIAGALDPALQAGDIIIAGSVTSGVHSIQTDAAISAAVQHALPSARTGAVLGVDRALAAPAEKAAEYRRTQALAVDMESHVAADFCRQNELPLLVLRAISDRADQELPPLTKVAISPNGGLTVLPIIWNIIRSPRQVGRLPSLAQDSRRAHAALAEARAQITPVLADYISR